MSKFTPGKWIYDGVAFIEAEDNRRLAMIYSCNVPEWQANARLLSNAQAMYEALHKAAETLSDCAECGIYSVRENLELIETLLASIDGTEEQP